jgi:hypothetical protein
MAELTSGHSAAACCPPTAQTGCCDPAEKATCCESATAGGVCGCAAGTPAGPSAVEPAAIREAVRQRYAAAARTLGGTETPSCGCASGGDRSRQTRGREPPPET